MSEEYTPLDHEVRNRAIVGAMASLNISDQEAERQLNRWLAKVRAEALEEAVAAMRAAWEGNWNLRDPQDPEVSYSVDRWLEVRAARLREGQQ